MMSILEKLDHFRIPLEDIKQATNNFSRENIIGPGGYGMVYKGELLCSNVLTKIAAKQVDRSIIFAEQHFLNEIRVFSSYRHVNIISFIGFCDESNEMILVQKFVAYKGLDNCLSNAKLKWLQRLQICLGVAHGLNYLQNGVEGHSVIHRDIRSRNILLDQSLQPQIARFGHSIMDSMHHTIDHEGIRGRPAYMDPTFLQTGIVTKESDIYSFGVVLFEVLCGRLAYETNEENEKQSLGPLARLHYETGRLNEIIDPILRNTMNPDSLESFSAIAYQCLETRQSHRPTMIQVVEKLEQVMSLQQEFDKALALQQVAQDLKRKQEDDHECYKVKNLEHMKIPLEQIKLATNDFHDDCLIGRGGYGKVYKADLFHFDVHKHVKAEKNIVSIELSGFDRRKSTVAVKRLDRRYGQGTAQFLQEISVLPYFKHQNLVTLLGFCDEGHERILVSEYASKGSLEEYICSTDSSKNHTWTQCLQICLDAAHGLEFLHNGVGEYHRIIHRDIKSSNILLSGNGVGKISDFGLSRIGPANLQATFVMTQVAGTLEYVDPQYNKTGMLTKESDVYSFGVVLFEVLCGRLAYFPRSKDDQEFLPHMAKRCFEQKKLYEIIDPKLKKELEKGFGDETCPDSISIFAAIAYKCLQKNRDDRPTMAEVVEELEKASKSHVKGVEGLRVSLDSIRFATNDFSHVIEQEGYHKVYRGELSYSKGHNAVTVKRFKPIVGSYGNKFDKVIAMLYSYCHKNIIPLLGFCEEAGERIAVFQHMANGSLKGHVKNPSLTWKQRLKICVDASHGIAHIHSAADAQHSIHGDIKSSIILLNHDWKAFISDFIIPKGVGTLGYYDPIYATTGIVTQKSDVYSFGVVLFEILSGRLAIETITIDKPQPLNGGEDAQVTFLSQWVAQCFKKERLEDIIFHGIKEQIDGKSLVIFSTIAYQCLQQKLEDRPTMDEVLKELEKALKCQDEWEWEQKLPKDYKKIIHMSKYSVSNISTKKDIHSILYSGILLHNEKQWFSISMDGVKNVVISATKFSYKNVKWRSIRKSRFPKVAKISDVSNLNIQINAKTQYLTPEIMYGAYLVFKFCDRRKVSNRPLYVNLKYKKSGKTLNAYFAEWSAGNNWLTVELFRFWNDKENIEFDVLLDSFSRYHCGSGGIFIEGIAFQAIHINIVNCSENVELNDGKNTGHLKNVSTLDLADELMAVDCREIINRSENNIGNAPKEELYLFLLEGILIDNGQKIFSISKRDRKKCHMLPATAVIYDHSDMKSYERKPRAQFRCRFEEFVEILSRHEFRIRCDVETKLLSSDTVYACFLVFMLPESCQRLKPVKARDLLPYKKERTKIISFTSPSMVNLDKIKWIPKQRKDGWMEVRVWETNCDVHNDDFIPMDLKLISFEGTMSGLMVCGIEFRPL